MKKHNIKGVIYKIENNINDKVYIGITTRGMQRRFKEHQVADSYIGKAMRKYGERNFRIKKIDEACNLEELGELEIKWIERYASFGSGYNLTVGGDGVDSVQRVDIILTERQKMFLEYIEIENKRALDVDNGRSVITTIILNLIKLYLTAEKINEKKMVATTISKLNVSSLYIIEKMGVLDWDEFKKYI